MKIFLDAFFFLSEMFLNFAESDGSLCGTQLRTNVMFHIHYASVTELSVQCHWSLQKLRL